MNDPQSGRGTISARRHTLVVAAIVAVCATAAAALQAPTTDADRRGQDLASRVVRAQDTVGFTARARVVVGSDTEAGPRPLVLQIRLLGRREAGGMRLLFQVFWPTALKGHAAVIDRRPRQPLGGFLFDLPDRVTPLSPALLTAPFAGTGLTLEDLADGSWLWPTHRIAGAGHADGQPCTLLESQPARGMDSAYARVRSCVDTKRAVPRWLEKFGPDGALLKRIVFERRRAKNRDEGARLTMVVTDAAGTATTRVEFLRSERDVAISPAEFSPAQLRRLGSHAPLEPRQDD
jgi:hypothetical protein